MELNMDLIFKDLTNNTVNAINANREILCDVMDGIKEDNDRCINCKAYSTKYDEGCLFEHVGYFLYKEAGTK